MATALYTTKQAAQYLGVSAAFLERDRWAGARIRYVRLGSRSIRYREEDLEHFIASNVRYSTSGDGEGNGEDHE